MPDNNNLKNSNPAINPTQPKINQRQNDNKSIKHSVRKPKDQGTCSDAYSLWDDDRMKGAYYWWE